MIPEARQLARFLERAHRVAVVSGAGVSTGSGIPDYRDRNGDWKHARPVQFADFIASASVRQRYWARSFAGWGRISGAEPNAAHYALAAMESAGQVTALITQNVDGLHHRAGSRRVIDLHGRLHSVRCLDCATVMCRDEWQRQLAAANPAWQAQAAAFAPDGDAALDRQDTHAFHVPACRCCGGIMKPDVVFFGESVPRERVVSAFEATDGADALLVVGSSLMVFSGYRFVRHAAAAGKPIAIVNRGRTRADELATLKIDAGCEEVLQPLGACRD